METAVLTCLKKEYRKKYYEENKERILEKNKNRKIEKEIAILLQYRRDKIKEKESLKKEMDKYILQRKY